MVRQFRLRYEDNGEPVENEIVYFVADGNRFRGRSDEDGKVRIDFPGELVEKVEIGPDTVKEDWFIGRNDYLDDVLIKNPDKDEYGGAEHEIRGMRGRVFWHDGTSMDQQLKVEFETGAGIRYSTDNRDSDKNKSAYIKDDGSFYIPVVSGNSNHDDWGSEIRFWFVGGDQIKFVKQRGENYFMLIMPERFGGGKSDKGGIITGRVVDENGHPVEGAKVTAQVAASGFFGLLTSAPEEPKARTGREGRFDMVFSGGRELKKI